MAEHFTIAQASALIQAKKLSPVELTRICLERTAQLDQTIHAYIRHTPERALAEAQAAEARIIGVNNRDLKTLVVNMETSFKLVEQIPDRCLAVAESGLRTHADLLDLRDAGFDAFLVGEHLMSAPDPGAALEALLVPPSSKA